MALRSLKSNDLLTVLPADKGNATVVMNTSDYNQKAATLLDDITYTKLKKDPTDSIEHGVISQKMIIIIVTAVETSNLTFNENIRFVAN
jgi:hypothetical protein